MERPSFSFIICAYNEENYIGPCIDAINVEMKLYNGYYPFEIIVVDDGSTDGTWLKACRENVRVLAEAHKGISASRQKGLQEAKYEYCAMIDADDRMPRGWLEIALNSFEVDPTVVAVSGPIRFYDTPEYLNTAAKNFYKLARFFHQWYPTIQGGNYIAKRDALNKAIAYNPQLDFWGEDTYTAVKLAAIGKITLNPQMVMNTSGRRLIQSGAVKTTTQYIMNYISGHILKRPVLFKHEDFR